MITHKQLTLAEIFEDCQNEFDNDKYQFLSLLDEAINLDEIVPVSFVSHFHAQTGRPRKYQLYPMLKALLLQRIFSIPTDTLLIVFLKYSQELRDFCGFDVVPDGSKFTRFKQDFLLDLQSMFDHLVDLTEPICQKLNPALADMTIFDTSGIEAWVMENNPKYANRIIKQLKAFKKSHNLDDSYDPYKAAYGSMPTHAASNQAIQQMYINGHFCYAYKFGIVTNGLGIVRDVTFYNKEFLKAHPDIVVEKKSDSPDEDKSLADSKALLPVLVDFFQKHPLISPKTFLGDAAFDTIEIYKALFGEIGFEKAFIPLHVKLSMEDNGYTINENGVPCCPHDPSLPMKREGSKSQLKSKIPTMKFVCPKMKLKTGEIKETVVFKIESRKYLKNFQKSNGWHINWNEIPKNVEVYALALKDDNTIQGLVGIRKDIDSHAAYLHWACTAPHNNLHEFGNQKYVGVGGHLFAIAADKSIE